MSRLRAGLIVYGLDRPAAGIGRYTLELARSLAGLEQEVELTLLAAGGIGPLSSLGDVRRAALPGCRLLPGLVTLGNLLLPRASRRLGLDMVHDPTGATPFLLGAGGARTVVTIHDVFPWSCPGTSTLLDTIIHRNWLPRVLPRVDAIIAVSRASKDDIVRYLELPPERIHVVHEGVSTRFRPVEQGALAAVRRLYGLPEGYILYLGSVEKRKNLSRLLHAFSLLRSSGRSELLVIAGAVRWKYAEVFSTLHELHLEPHVQFAGHVNEADLPALYAGADLLVFPSLYEGFGLPPLEAMACGTPVVCSNAASLPEVVGDAALMVDPCDVEGLSAAMLRVLTEPELAAELRQRGLARAAGFTWERTARETVAVYRKVLGN